MTERWAATAEEARRRAERWAERDPFPRIPPALLNSSDLSDYVAATAMLYPFHENDDKLKPASYEVDLLGRCVSWDEAGQLLDEDIGRGKPLVLRANSITFVTVEPTFRLPPYIALRFNLRITHVYRGLLLGTGPLIDPGFSGPLSIPLHNLTTNDYTIYGGDGLIWMEFTKLSPLPGFPGAARSPARRGRYVALPPAKRGDLDVMDYLRKAEHSLQQRPIRSGIPKATQDARDAATEAKDVTVKASAAATKAEARLRSGTWIAGITLLLATAALVAAFWQLLSQTQARLDAVTPSVGRVAELERKVEGLEAELRDVRSSGAATPEVSSMPTEPAAPQPAGSPGG